MESGFSLSNSVDAQHSCCFPENNIIHTVKPRYLTLFIYLGTAKGWALRLDVYYANKDLSCWNKISLDGNILNLPWLNDVTPNVLKPLHRKCFTLTEQVGDRLVIGSIAPWKLGNLTPPRGQKMCRFTGVLHYKKHFTKLNRDFDKNLCMCSCYINL